MPKASYPSYPPPPLSLSLSLSTMGESPQGSNPTPTPAPESALAPTPALKPTATATEAAVPPPPTAAVMRRPHPLQEIAESPTHKLLLKQWLKEQDLIVRRSALRESQIDAVRRDLAFLYCGFFALQSLFCLLLLSSPSPSSPACRRSWIPCATSFLLSMAIIWAVRYKTDAETHAERLLARDREDGMLLDKCLEELKRKGNDFDLLKEVDALRRAKSLRVDSRSGGGAPTAVRKWSTRDLGTGMLFAAACPHPHLRCSRPNVRANRPTDIFLLGFPKGHELVIDLTVGFTLNSLEAAAGFTLWRWLL